MNEHIMNFYGDVIFIYSMGMIISYVILIWLAAITIIRNKTATVESYAKKVIGKSPYTPGVSIIAQPTTKNKPLLTTSIHCLPRNTLNSR